MKRIKLYIYLTDSMKTIAGEMETAEIECLDCNGTGRIDPYEYYSVNCYEETKGG